MRFGIEQHPIRRDATGDVGECEVVVDLLTLWHGIGELIFVHIEDYWWAPVRPERLEVRYAQHVGAEYKIEILRIRNGPGEVKRRAPHPPFPEPVRHGLEGEGML